MAKTPWISLVVASGLAFTHTARAQIQRTVYIDECMDYSGNGCGDSTDLNEITADLRQEMLDTGFTVTRYVESSAWPQDFFESCSSSYGSSGLDNYFSDAALVTVFAGHGNVGHMTFGYPHASSCYITIGPQMRLGYMGGQQSGYGIYMASKLMSFDCDYAGLRHFFPQWLNQQFGFHNSPAIGDGQPGEFWDETGDTTNRMAWLEELEDKSGWFTGDNSPVVFSAGRTSAECWGIHDSTSFQTRLWTRRGGGSSCGGGYAYVGCYSIRNHGGGGC